MPHAEAKIDLILTGKVVPIMSGKEQGQTPSQAAGGPGGERYAAYLRGDGNNVTDLSGGPEMEKSRAKTPIPEGHSNMVAAMKRKQ